MPEKLTLSFDSPFDAVFLRILAWEIYVAERNLRVRDLTKNEIQHARQELGLKDIHKGYGESYLQALREKKCLTKNNEPIGNWKNEWRVLYLPSHSLVRQLSENPIFQKSDVLTQFTLTLRNAALPSLEVILGGKETPTNKIAGKRGLYLLRLDDGLYIGKTDEVDVRLNQHGRKNPIWWIFIYSQDYPMTLDTLNATESLLISFWNEICEVSNRNRGNDRKPDFLYLQQAILLSTAVSAAWLWIVEKYEEHGELFKAVRLPFKKWRGKDWPDCYKSKQEQE